MSRRAIKMINWDAIVERIPQNQKNMLAAFRAKSDQYLRRMQENPEASPQLDWEYYRKSIKIPGFVDKFKKEYESLKIPFPEDKYTSLIDSEEKQILVEIENFRVECEQLIAKENEQIAHWKSIMPYDQMTMEDFLEHHPEYETGTVDKPSIWPHTPEMLIAEELGKLEHEEELRKYNES